MANPNPPTKHLKPYYWQPGQSGNPLGPYADKKIRELRALTKEQFKELAEIILTGTTAELKAILDDPKESTLKKWVARIAVQGITQGDMKRLDVLLNRLIGTVKVHADVNISGQVTHTLDHESFIRKLREAQAQDDLDRGLG